MNGQWYAKPGVTISLHLLAWALFFSFPFLLRPVAHRSGTSENNVISSSLFYFITLNNFLRVGLFYTNANLLIPRLLYRNKYWQYASALVLSLGVLLLFDMLFFSLIFPQWNYSLRNFFYFNIPVFVFILLASTAFRTIRDKIGENQRIRELQTENLKTELSLLRSQVSPHFMFNVLNNMVALARKKSDLLEPSLIKLSQLLRYMLYETEGEKMLLANEINYLQSYIDLQKQRFGKNAKIEVDLPRLETAHRIEPMLLIPFVENAFKHGTGLPGTSEIDIALQVKGNTLLFSVRNRVNGTEEPKDRTSGIGLANVKRRLDLLYPEQHTLTILNGGDSFSVNLQLMLH